jgi:hypothetical protein
MAASGECFPNIFYDDSPDSEETKLLNLIATSFPGVKTISPKLLAKLERYLHRGTVHEYEARPGRRARAGIDFENDRSFHGLKQEFKNYFCLSDFCALATESVPGSRKVDMPT